MEVAKRKLKAIMIFGNLYTQMQ